MCIRDRSKAGSLSEAANAVADALREPGAVILVGERLAANPVSYTHLRAHETVLDLVCRLLLEKKTLNGSHAYDVQD